MFFPLFAEVVSVHIRLPTQLEELSTAMFQASYSKNPRISMSCSVACPDVGANMKKTPPSVRIDVVQIEQRNIETKHNSQAKSTKNLSTRLVDFHLKHVDSPIFHVTVASNQKIHTPMILCIQMHEKQLGVKCRSWKVLAFP